MKSRSSFLFKQIMSSPKDIQKLSNVPYPSNDNNVINIKINKYYAFSFETFHVTQADIIPHEMQ